MEPENSYDNIIEVAERLNITTNKIIKYAVDGWIDIATFIDFAKITHIEPYPIDTVNVPTYGSGIYYIGKRDIIKFQFNSDESTIVINHIYPSGVSSLDEGFPITNTEDDISLYAKVECMNSGNKPLLCLTISDYSINIKNLVLTSDDIEFFDRMLKYENNNDTTRKILPTISINDKHKASSLATDEKLLAEKGRKFTLGCKKTRNDNLRKALDCVVEAYRAEHPNTKRLPSYDIIKKMKELKETNNTVRKIIIEIDKEAQEVSWKRQNGIETTTSYKRIGDRLSEFRSMLKSKK